MQKLPSRMARGGSFSYGDKEAKAQFSARRGRVRLWAVSAS